MVKLSKVGQLATCHGWFVQWDTVRSVDSDVVELTDE